MAIPVPKIRHRKKTARFLRRHMPLPDKFPAGEQSPIVIGAIGGSGTRALAQILIGAGIYLGTNLNRQSDSRDLSAFMNANLNDLLDITQSVNYGMGDIPEPLRTRISRKFLRAIHLHLTERDGEGFWGWKLPRSIYALPLIGAHFPCFRFIHMVRDGRDMALSTNQFQYVRHGNSLLGRGQDRASPSQHRTDRSLRLWAKVNGEAADWAGRNLPAERYFLLRFEDLCQSPVAVLTDLFRWLGQNAPVDILAARIAPPASLGRHFDAAIPIGQEELHVLKRFGYT